MPSGKTRICKYPDAICEVQVKPFPSLRKKTKDYIKECQAIADPVDLIPWGPIPHHSKNGLKPSKWKEVTWLPGEIPTKQTEVSFTFMQPPTVPAATTQPLITMSDQTQKSPGYCAIYTPAGKQCPKEYPMPLKSNWSDSEEEEKDTNVKNEVEEEIEDWDSDIQKQKDLKEQKLKNYNNKTPQSSPKSMSISTSDNNNTEILIHSSMTL